MRLLNNFMRSHDNYMSSANKILRLVAYNCLRLLNNFIGPKKLNYLRSINNLVQLLNNYVVIDYV